jgi:hypothetical protein
MKSNWQFLPIGEPVTPHFYVAFSNERRKMLHLQDSNSLRKLGRFGKMDKNLTDLVGHR